jgi:hypothetical protein
MEIVEEFKICRPAVSRVTMGSRDHAV